MCEIKLNQILHKNPELINCLIDLLLIRLLKSTPYSEYYLSQYGIIAPI